MMRGPGTGGLYCIGNWHPVSAFSRCLSPASASPNLSPLPFPVQTHFQSSKSRRSSHGLTELKPSLPGNSEGGEISRGRLRGFPGGFMVKNSPAKVVQALIWKDPTVCSG